ncbi:MAG: S-adenosylmethionine:tRNA ribosyltransferase-isomerase, partial [bacterium]|nr:S-adenosylmethionine:tRNA ribosyltransferase-isomerase [bacterium]
MPIFAADYDYELPRERIAQRPAERRDGSRLMVLVGNRPPEHLLFPDLPKMLREGDVLVANDSRV